MYYPFFSINYNLLISMDNGRCKTRAMSMCILQQCIYDDYSYNVITAIAAYDMSIINNLRAVNRFWMEAFKFLSHPINECIRKPLGTYISSLCLLYVILRKEEVSKLSWFYKIIYKSLILWLDEHLILLNELVIMNILAVRIKKLR